ncbi:MAG: AbrB/MazE/SpoVT family DNA-binding domain-containing protein [Verrucomicrobiota bacterium]
MTTVLSTEKNVSIPDTLCQELDISPGDNLEIFRDGADSLVIRKITSRPNEGLIDLLLACPHPIEIADSSHEFPREVDLSE